MRNHLQVIRSLLGDADFLNVQHLQTKDKGPFQYFRLHLDTPRYRGFLPVWDVAVVLDTPQPRSRSSLDAVYEAANRLIDEDRRNEQPSSTQIPLLILSDDPRVKLLDTLPNHTKRVFLVDHSSLPAIRPGEVNPTTSPLVKVVRNQLTRPNFSALMFSPYLRNRPASGWRFFGRKRELEVLEESDESFFVVGGRRMGKTSLLKELERRISANGMHVVFVDVEACQDEDEVVRKILQNISEKDAASAMRRQLALSEPFISSVLRKVTSRGGRVVLILDELGNVIARQPKDQWKLLGTLREYSHGGKLRVVVSCFQELFQKQAIDRSGPLVNFGSVLRLHALSPGEVDEMVVAPLLHWARINNTKALLQLVLASIGRHPYVLQTFCQELFQRLMKQPDRDVLAIAKAFLDSDAEYTSCFREAVEEIFSRALTPLLRYLYLLRCREGDLGGAPLSDTVIDDDWLDLALEKMGYLSSLDDRSDLLQELEMRGMIDQKDDRRSAFIVVSPMVYYYHKKAGVNFDLLFEKFRREVKVEHERWGLKAL